nr:MAG: RNA-dependent RNA polymerase [brine shrimp yue-like virus 2]
MADNLITSDNLLHIILAMRGEKASLNRTVESRAQLYLEMSRSLVEVDKSGLIEEAITKSFSEAKRMFSTEKAKSRTEGRPIRIDPPLSLNGNASVWRIVDDLLSSNLYEKVKSSKLYKSTFNKLIASVDSFVARSGRAFMFEETPRIKNVLEEDIDFISVVASMSKALRRLYGMAEHDFKAYMSSRKGFSEKPLLLKNKLRFEEITKENFPVEVRMASEFVAIRFNGTLYPLTVTHFKRLTSFLDQLGYLSLGLKELAVLDHPRILFRDLFRVLRPIFLSDANLVGEVLKGVKSSLVMRLATDNLISDSQEEDFVDAMDPTRAYWVREIKQPILRMFPTIEDAINFLNIYKIVPHPDINTSTAFENLQGLLNPNKVDSNLVTRFVGTLRKATAESLLSQGKQFRLIANEPEGQHLAELSLQADIKKAEMMSASYIQWAAVSFHNPQRPADMKDIVVKPSSKTSLKYTDLNTEGVEQALKWSANPENQKPDFLNEIKGTNDAAEALKGSTGLHFEPAIRKFREVIRGHEELEANEGVNEPEDIDPKTMYNYLMRNPKYAYVIGTEGKFGETHKKTTRMFYIAPENLKTIIQRVERFVKQVYRKAPGVSIVKSYAARRSDLENFTRSMTESTDIDKSIFVSFDMSEFSKKFPMLLIRKFGEVLFELAGEEYEWLKRLDLVFRASLVIHNTRGFFDLIGGVKGGFEGFLNFTWSIIHSIIMRISLESTGVSGKLLTFSDDGLLQFYTSRDENRESIRAKVDSIKDIYSSLGLEFKVTKTIVSGKVWEYLGDVCYQSKLLPCYIKEMCSLGKRVMNRGIELFYERIKSIQAQAAAFSNSGGSPVISYILKRFMCSVALEERFGIKSERLIEWLLITPASAGGFRIMSPAESSLLSDISQDAEYLADLETYQLTYSNVMPQLLPLYSHGVQLCVNPLRAIMGSSIFHLQGYSTTGGGIIKAAIEEIKKNPLVNHQVTGDPLDGEIGVRLNSVLKEMNNINPITIRRLVQSTPAWSEYSDTTALLKSSGAIRLIKRSSLKRLQFSDTKRCAKAIEMWEIKLNKYDPGPVDIFRMYEQVSEKSYLALSMMPLKLSPRTVMKAVRDNGEIIVTCSELPYKTQGSAPYAEPKVNFPYDVTTGSWMLESKGDKGTQNIRNFLIESARAVAYSLDSVHVVVALAACMGFNLPSGLGGHYRASHRPSVSRSTDARAILPRLFDAWSNARYTGNLADEINRLARADRRSYLEAARVFSCLVWSSFKRSLFSSKGDHHIRNFNVVGVKPERLFTTPVQSISLDYKPEWDLQPLPELQLNEFQSAVGEFCTFDKDKATLEDITRGVMALSEEQRMWYSKLATKSLENWLVSRISRSKGSLFSERPPPILLLDPLSVIRRAIIGASWRMLDPTQRRALADYIHATKKRFIRKAPIVPMEVLEELRLHYEECSLILYMANVPGSNLAYFSEISSNTASLVKEAESVCLLYDLSLVRLGDHEKPIVILPHGTLATQFTKAHKEIFKMFFTNTISWIFSIFSQNWDTYNQEVLSMVGGDSIDETLDLLYICRALVRESEHRSKYKPYNPNAAKIELFKFYACAEWLCMNHADQEEEKLRELAAEFRLNDDDKMEIRNQLAGAKEEIGPDHARLIETGVLTEVINRLMTCLKINSKGEKDAVIEPSETYLRIDPDTRRRYNPDVYYRIKWKDANAAISCFYNNIITIAADNIQERSSDIEKVMLDRFVPSSKARVEAMNMKVTSLDKIYARPLDLNLLDSKSRDALMFLLTAHVREVVYSKFLIGLQADLESRSLTGSVCAPVYSKDGPTVSYLGEGLETKLVIFSLSCKTSMEALHAHYVLASNDLSSVSTFKCSTLTERPYIVSGIRELKTFPMISQRESPPNLCITPHNIGCDVLIDTLTIGGQAQLVARIADMRAEISNKHLPDISPPAYMDNFAMFVNTFEQVNLLDPYIQAASMLAKESHSPAAVSNSLVVITLYIVTNTVLSIEAYKEQYNRAYNSFLVPDTLKEAIPAARAAHQWLFVSRISPGKSVNHKTITDAFRFMKEKRYVDSGYTAGVICKHPRKLSDVVRWEGEFPDKILKNVEDILFIKPHQTSSLSSPDSNISHSGMSDQEALRVLTAGKYSERRPLYLTTTDERLPLAIPGSPLYSSHTSDFEDPLTVINSPNVSKEYKPPDNYAQKLKTRADLLRRGQPSQTSQRQRGGYYAPKEGELPPRYYREHRGRNMNFQDRWCGRNQAGEQEIVDHWYRGPRGRGSQMQDQHRQERTTTRVRGNYRDDRSYPRGTGSLRPPFEQSRLPFEDIASSGGILHRDRRQERYHPEPSDLQLVIPNEAPCWRERPNQIPTFRRRDHFREPAQNRGAIRPRASRRSRGRWVQPPSDSSSGQLLQGNTSEPTRHLPTRSTLQARQQLFNVTDQPSERLASEPKPPELPIIKSTEPIVESVAPIMPSSWADLSEDDIWDVLTVKNPDSSISNKENSPESTAEGTSTPLPEVPINPKPLPGVDIFASFAEKAKQLKKVNPAMFDSDSSSTSDESDNGEHDDKG